MITSKYTPVKQQPFLKTLKTLPSSLSKKKKKRPPGMMYLNKQYLWVPQGFGFSFKFTFTPSLSGPFIGANMERQASFESSCILWCDANEIICDFPFLNYFSSYLHGLQGRLISTHQDTCMLHLWKVFIWKVFQMGVYTRMHDLDLCKIKMRC